jgi:hypothetical protein
MSPVVSGYLFGCWSQVFRQSAEKRRNPADTNVCPASSSTSSRNQDQTDTTRAATT